MSLRRWLPEIFVFRKLWPNHTTELSAYKFSLFQFRDKNLPKTVSIFKSGFLNCFLHNYQLGIFHHELKLYHSTGEFFKRKLMDLDICHGDMVVQQKQTNMTCNIFLCSIPQFSITKNYLLNCFNQDINSQLFVCRGVFELKFLDFSTFKRIFVIGPKLPKSGIGIHFCR